MNLSDIKALASRLPAGPWGWFGGETSFYLATKHSGRQYLMTFIRRGMNSAQPMFRTGNTMKPASELTTFEVGDRTVVGFKEARKNGSVYRYDVNGFDNDVARWFAAIDPTTVSDLVTKAEANTALIATLTEALERLLLRDERNTCPHEDTHRGGFLWEICDACGAKWADDEGGKPEWIDPPEWVEARTALSLAKTQTGERT